MRGGGAHHVGRLPDLLIPVNKRQAWQMEE